MSRSRLLILIALVLAALGGVGLWQWRAQQGEGGNALSKGLAAIDEGRMRVARVELMNAIKHDPRSISARLAQARVLIELGDGSGAQAQIDRARALGASSAATRVPMAQAMLLQGDAQDALIEATASDIPGTATVAAARVAAEAQAARGDMDVARATLGRALGAAPGDADNWMALSRIAAAAGDQAEAIRAADRAVALAPADAKALAGRASLIRTQYGLIAALPWFERALAIDPDSVPTLEAYAATLADAGQAGRMLAVTRRILALDPGNPRAYLMQAILAARAGEPALARSLLDRTHGRFDGEPATQLLRGILHLQDGNALLAVQTLGPLVDAQPDNRAARTLLARAALLTGDAASSATLLAPMVAQRDADPYVLTLAARAQAALGQGALAQDMLARAAWPTRAAADPFASPADDRLAALPPADPASARGNIPYIRALLSTGRTPQAFARARLLAKANPGAPDAWVVLGDTLIAGGQPKEAARIYAAAANMRFDRSTALRLAAAWTRAGDPVRAGQVLRLFLAQNPADPEALRLAASAAMQAREWPRALDLLRAMVAKSGAHDALLLANLARASLETGDMTGALTHAKAAYALMPANPLIADTYGLAMLKSGTGVQPAIDLFEKAVSLAPGYQPFGAHLAEAQRAASNRKS